MSKLLQRIKADQLRARKGGETAKALTLTTLIGEASPSGNETRGDADVEAVLRKFIKNLRDIMGYSQRVGVLERMNDELELLESYLPKQMTEDEIRAEVQRLIDMGCVNVGAVMRDMKELHGKNFDGKVASSIAKELLP